MGFFWQQLLNSLMVLLWLLSWQIIAVLIVSKDFAESANYSGN